MRTFQIQNNSGDPSPWLLYPTSQNNVWVVTVRYNPPALAQIVNFTLLNSGAWISKSVSNLTNTIPWDIVYDNFTHRVWLVENDSLAFYNQTSHQLSIAHTFQNAGPQYMTIASRDHLWLTLYGTDQIIDYNQSSGNYHAYSTPTTNSGLQGITVSPTDGTIWFAEISAGKIGQLTPCSSPVCPITEYSPPAGLDIRGVIQVAVDNSGIVWFTVHSGNEFGSFNPSNGEWKLFPIGYCPENLAVDCQIGLPNALSLDHHGQVWFAEHVAGRIGRYNPNSGQLVEYRLPTSSKTCAKNCSPLTWWMWPGQANLVWFVDFGIGQIGYVNATAQSLPTFSTTSSPNISVVQGGSASFQVSAAYMDQAPLLNVSLTYLDASSSPPMLSWSMGTARVSTVDQSETATVTVSAAWSSSLGSRYVAISAYNQNVTVNSFVKVDVVASLEPYATIGLAGGLSAFTAAVFFPRWFTKNKRKMDAESKQLHRKKNEKLRLVLFR